MIHLSEAQIAGYRSRTLAPAERVAMGAHLKECEACRQQLLEAEEREGRLAPAFALFQAHLQPSPAEAPFHLSDEQLIDYVDQRWDAVDPKRAAAHLEACPRCTAAMEELRGFQGLMSADAPREHQPRRPAAGWQKLQAVFPRPTVWVPLQAAGMAAAAAVVWFMAGAQVQRVGQEARASRAQANAAQATARRLEAELRAQQRQALAAEKLTVRVKELSQTNQALRAKVAQLAPRPAPPRPSPAAGGGGAPPISPPSPRPAPRLVLNDGGQEVLLDERGALLRLPTAVKEALTRKRVPRPVLLASLQLGVNEVRGGAEDGPKVRLLEPVGKVVIVDRPPLKWRAAPGATRYRVTIYRAVSGDVDVPIAAQSPEPGIVGTEWTPERPLPRGQTYAWEVRALNGDEELGRAAPAKFRILEQPRLDEFERYRSSPLTLGVLYAAAGLPDEAEQQLRSVPKKNPPGTPGAATVRRLLESVRAMRPRKP